MLGIVVEMPFRERLRRWLIRWKPRLSWLIRASKRKIDKTSFLGSLGIAISLLFLAIGFGMNGHYIVARWCFILACVSLAFSGWYGLAFLAKRARRVWTVVIWMASAVAMMQGYRLCCPTVTIKPTRLEFSGLPVKLGMSVSKDFRVRNASDADVYSVTFLVKGLSPSMGLKGFRLNIPDSSVRIFPAHNGIAIGDVIQIVLMDSSRHSLFLCGIHHLAPGESRDVSVTRLNPREAKADDKVPDQAFESPTAVRLCIVDFTLDSTALGSPSSQAFPFKTPKETECK
jgi:hypothetical protein